MQFYAFMHEGEAMQIKKVPITLDKPRTLLFDVNALVDLGDALNLNLMTREGWEELVGKMQAVPPTHMSDEPKEEFVSNASFAKVRAIVWAGLRHEDESLTQRQVGAMLDPANLAPVIAAYTEAFQAGDVLEAKDPNVPTPASSVAAG
jgi:hypothetical protein